LSTLLFLWDNNSTGGVIIGSIPTPPRELKQKKNNNVIQSDDHWGQLPGRKPPDFKNGGNGHHPDRNNLNGPFNKDFPYN